MASPLPAPAAVREKWKSRLANSIWILLPLLGLAFFLYRNTHESAWVDENWTLGVSSTSFASLWGHLTKDYNPPLYYYLLWLFRWIFGPSLFAARAFSALTSFGLLLLGAWPFRRACGNTAALLFMALAVLSPAYVAYAQDVRMYSMAAFAVFGMAVYLYLAIRDGNRADWVKALLFTILAMYVHIYALAGAFFVGVYSLLYAVIVHRKRIVPCIAVLGVSFVAFLPWLFVLIGQIQKAAGRYWIPPLDQNIMRDAIVYPLGMKFFAPETASVAAAVILIASVAGLFAAMRKAKPYAFAVICFLAFFSTTEFMFVVSWVVRPFVWGRYMLPLAGLLFAAGAFGLAQLRRVIVVHAMAVLMICEVPFLIALYTNRYGGPMTEVVEYLKDKIGPGDVIVSTDEHSMVSFSHYFPDNPNILYQRPDSAIYMELTVFPNAGIVTDLREIDAGGNRVWVVRMCSGANYAAYADAAAYYGLDPVPEFTCRQDYGSAKLISIPNSWWAYYLDPSPPIVPPAATETPVPPSASPSGEMLEDLRRMFSGVSVRSQDDFPYIPGGAMPHGWTVSAAHSLQLIPENQVFIRTAEPYTVFFYEGEMITPQTGIAFSFEYTGASGTFTLGMDAVTPGGGKIPQGPGFHSVAMKMENANLSAHAIRETDPETAEAFQGGLALMENTWYEFAIGFDDRGTYVIRIWEPGNTDGRLTYDCDCRAFPATYYFVGFMEGTRSLRMDNFTIFDFQDISEDG